MQWFEYDKAEEMLEAIQNNINILKKDILVYGKSLSSNSLSVLKNEIGKLSMHKEDVERILFESA